MCYVLLTIMSKMESKEFRPNTDAKEFIPYVSLVSLTNLYGYTANRYYQTCHIGGYHNGFEKPMGSYMNFNPPTYPYRVSNIRLYPSLDTSYHNGKKHNKLDVIFEDENDKIKSIPFEIRQYINDETAVDRCKAMKLSPYSKLWNWIL